MHLHNIKRFLADSQIRCFITPDGMFLKKLAGNFTHIHNKTNIKKMRPFEMKWGLSKIKEYDIPHSGSQNFWSGPLGEYYAYCALTDSGKNVRRPIPINRLTPDWECDNYIYEIKTRNYTSTGSIGEKALGIPYKYADIPELYKKPLKIILVGKLEYEGINKYGVITCNNNHVNLSINKTSLISAYNNIGIGFLGGSQLLSNIP